MKDKKGFSLTELLAVLVIIGIVILVVIPVSQRMSENKQVKEHQLYFKTLVASVNDFLDTEQGFYVPKKASETEHVFVPFENWQEYKGEAICLNYIDSYVSTENPNYACNMSLEKFLDLGYHTRNNKIEEMINLRTSYINIGLNSDKNTFFLDSLKIMYRPKSQVTDGLVINNERVNYYYYNYGKMTNGVRVNYENGFYKGATLLYSVGS